MSGYSDLADIGKQESIEQPIVDTSKTIEPSASQNASMLASKHASMLANGTDDVFAPVRNIVKQKGQETVFVRLTTEEKDALFDIIYTYKKLRIRTNENEVARIGISYLLLDYERNGEQSILHNVMERLKA